MIYFIEILYKLFRFFVLLQILKYLYINYNQWDQMNQLYWYIALIILDFWLTKNIIYVENETKEIDESNE